MTIEPKRPSRKQIAYRYDETAIRAWRRAISDERFATYLRIADGDRRRALQFYTRNVALGAAFHGPLQALEVTLRNAVDDAMTEAYGASWLMGAPLRAPEQEAVRKATQSLEQSRKPRTPARLVAASNLGFWVALFARKYDETLWRTTLHTLFGTDWPRSEVHKLLNRLRTLRNRIAHHEPIFHRHLRADHEGILSLLDDLSPETAAWVAHHSRVPKILAESSHRIGQF